MKDYIKDLVKINNLLVSLHPTGDDILVVAEAIVSVRKMIQQSNADDDGGAASATV